MDVSRIHAKKLLKFDIDEICIFVEIIQLSFVTFFLLLGIIFVIDKIFVHSFHNGQYDREEEIQRMNQKSTLELSFILFLRILLYCFVYYYVLKIIKIVPSIPKLLYPSFDVHQNLSIVIDIVFLVLLIGLSDFVTIPMGVLSGKIINKAK